MANYCILYNPLSDNRRGTERAHELDVILADHSLEYIDLTTIQDVRTYLMELPAETTVVLCGGDGTINCFVNALDDQDPGRDIYYFATGTGNDFQNDLQLPSDQKLLLLNPYMKDLPIIHVKGMTRYFLNGIGYGIDGYCCEVGDQQRAMSDKPVNYTAIAIKGLLFHYHRTRAEIIIDGKTTTYKHVWLAPTMNGRFFGGGMMCAPQQDRLNEDRHVTVMVMRSRSKLRALAIFPSIFKGGHIKHTGVVSTMPGYTVHIKFDRPTALQIDGETVLGVTEYSVESAAVYKKAHASAAEQAQSVRT